MNNSDQKRNVKNQYYLILKNRNYEKPRKEKD